MNMSIALFVITIVAIVFGTGLLRDYLKTRRKELDSGGDASEYESKIAALEERIRVLERIVTEKNYDLKKKIGEL